MRNPINIIKDKITVLWIIKSQLIKLIFTFIFISLFAMPVLSSTTMVYGPQSFTRGTGSPVIETVTFAITDTTATYTLYLYNGGMDNHDLTGELVSSSIIVLNSSKVFGTNEFSQDVAFLSKIVTLQTDNTLTVELRGKPGGVVTLEIVGESDNTPPTITSTPVTNAIAGVLYQNDVNASDTDGDPLTFTLTIAPVGMVIDSATGMINWVPLEAGTETVEVKVDDGHGGTATQSYNIIVNPDLDGDGIPDESDPDIDGDGINNYFETQLGTDPLDPNNTPPDFDGDGIPDELDPDANGNGIPDDQEGQTTTYTYNALGLVTTIDNPRIDVVDITTFDYDAQGNLIKTTNALGHMTDITAFDVHGRPLTIIDPNGTVNSLSYDARGRLLTRTVDGQITTFEYDSVGNITKTILPNGSFLLNEYDAAQRLIAVEDNLGNRIEYTLDNFGNHIQEDIKDPSDILTRTLNRTYNVLNRLIETVGGAGQTMTFDYDGNGNQTAITVDPTVLNQVTIQAYDALNRLATTTDAMLGQTDFAYDARNNLTGVTDPTRLTTIYVFDAFNNLIQQQSPDTGLTIFNYDAAGNRTFQTDARGITTRFIYDALNRLTNITYPDATQNVTYTYDTCTEGIGRLCQMDDESGTTTWTYDGRGNQLTQTTIIDGITQTMGYAYNGADQLMQITYPSGRTVDYMRNVMGQIDNITITQGEATVPLIGNVSYQPFGPMATMNHGNGLNHTRSFDLDYRLTNLVTGTLQDLTYQLNVANNIIDITNHVNTTHSQLFEYDLLNRLTDATGIYEDLDYTYDGNGNRLSDDINSSSLKTYTYDAVSHHLLQTVNGGTIDYNYDANGNTISNTDFDFTYGDNNRLKEAQVNGVPVAISTYNGRGERVKKEGSFGTTFFYYDQSGQVIAETDVLGNPIREYVYFDGQPVALITFTGVNYIHTDHLATPQLITDGVQTVVWQADYNPFGEANITTELITNNLRFPGQYYDQETELHYNYHRYYDPQLDRYITSDPIGLDGGVNTYLYALANPIMNMDLYGLDTAGCDGMPTWLQPITRSNNCILNCCAKHDKCYDDFNCTQESWTGNETGCDPSGCDKCNTKVTRCFAKCFALRTIGHFFPYKNQYYCAARHKFIKIPRDFPTVEAAQLACELDQSTESCCGN